MQPRERDTDYLADIVGAARIVVVWLKSVSREEFDDDLQLQSAVVHQILIAGEAVKRLSQEFREGNSDVPWRRIAAMRDVLVHLYDQIDYGTVWTVGTEQFPGLIARLEPLLPPPPED
jgi:uncharacterized protein with HEPN domain